MKLSGQTDSVPVPAAMVKVHGWIASLWGQNKLRLSEMMKDHVITLFCFQPIAVQQAHLCETSRHTPRSPFLVHQTQKPVNCSLRFIRLFCHSASCHPRSHLAAWPAFSCYCGASLILSLAGCWLDAKGWARGGRGVSCLVVSGQEKPHSCVPTLKPARNSAGAAGAAGAFKCKASLQLSQLQVKDPGGSCSEVTQI